jgi:hypothetical protein
MLGFAQVNDVVADCVQPAREHLASIGSRLKIDIYIFVVGSVRGEALTGLITCETLDISPGLGPCALASTTAK